MPLEMESLINAVDSLRRSLDAVGGDLGGFTDDQKETLRAGVIQNFEVAYEQCWKFTQRWLRENRSPEDADFPKTRKDLFRMAAKHGLISDPAPWFGFGEARNLTSHTYDHAQAERVYDAAVGFLPYAQELVTRLKERND